MISGRSEGRPCCSVVTIFPDESNCVFTINSGKYKLQTFRLPSYECRSAHSNKPNSNLLTSPLSVVGEPSESKDATLRQVLKSQEPHTPLQVHITECASD